MRWNRVREGTNQASIAAIHCLCSMSKISSVNGTSSSRLGPASKAAPLMTWLFGK